MPYQEFQIHWNTFSKLVDQMLLTQNERINEHVQHYIRQNIILLNDVLSVSLNNLQKLQKAASEIDIICAQAQLSNEIHEKISCRAKQFLDTSSGKMSTNYDEWLQAQCDLATD